MPKEYIDKTNNFLEKIEFKPIGQKCKMLYLLMQTIKGLRRGQHKKKLPKKLVEFEFLRELDSEKLFEVFYLVKEAHDSQEKALMDMKTVFDAWHVNISKENLERISYPEGCELLVNDCGKLQDVRSFSIFLKSPGIAKWVDKNTKGEIVCDKGVLNVMHQTGKERAAAFARSILFYDKMEAMIRGFTKHHQINTIQVATYKSNSGNKKAVPIKKPGLLMLYLILKKSEKVNVTLVSVIIPHSMLVKNKEKYKKELEQCGWGGVLSKSMEKLYNSITSLDKNYKGRKERARFER